MNNLKTENLLIDPVRKKKVPFLTFPACSEIPIIFSNLNSDCSTYFIKYEKPPGTS